MDIWIIQNGEKTGPIHDFEVRKKIEAGELSPTTPAWHEGLPEWKPLGEISLFEREFELPHGRVDTPYSPPESPSEPPARPPVTAQSYPIRRFWARWLDLYLFAGVWWLTMWAVGRDIGATLGNAWFILFLYVPWFALESFLLHRFGTTPGKWLLGLKVVNDDGSPLSLAAATRRSMRVLFLGIGSMEGPGTKTFSDQLTQAGITNVYYESPGTAHEWLTWRRCFREFAPRLFR